MFVVGIVIFLLELEAYKYSNRHPHFSWEPELLMATEFKKLQASEQGRQLIITDLHLKVFKLKVVLLMCPPWMSEEPEVLFSKGTKNIKRI